MGIKTASGEAVDEFLFFKINSKLTPTIIAIKLWSTFRWSIKGRYQYPF